MPQSDNSVASIPFPLACATELNITDDAFADQEERPRDHILVADLRSPKSTRA